MKKLTLILVLVFSTRASGQFGCTWSEGHARCLGDRNCDAIVQVSDTQNCVTMSLNEPSSGQEYCTPTNPACADDRKVAVCDLDCDSDIEINELQTVVNNNLNGCFTPTFNGYDYPIGALGGLCTHTIWVQAHCGPTKCAHANCPSCP